MNNRIKCSLAAAMLALGAFQASALQVFDLNLHGVLLQAGSNNDRASGTFDISPPYNPATHTLVSAEVYFFYSDDNILGDIPFLGDSEEWVRIRLDDGNGGFSTLLNEEVGILDNASESLFGSAFASLSADGHLDYRVIATRGDFYFNAAKLVAEINPNARVPDGGATLALLGLGLFGVGALRRRR